MLIGLLSAYLITRLRAKTARGLAEQILANANLEAETIRRQGELAAKEEVFKRREDFEAEIDRVRRDFREQERRLDKRADMLDQKLELINNKEIELVKPWGDRWPNSRRKCGSGRPRSSKRSPLSSKTCSASAAFPPMTLANCS